MHKGAFCSFFNFSGSALRAVQSCPWKIGSCMSILFLNLKRCECVSQSMCECLTTNYSVVIFFEQFFLIISILSLQQLYLLY